MYKQAALKFIRNKMGYVPYIMLFEIYKDSDIIPQYLIEQSIRKDTGQGTFLICNENTSKIIKEYLEKSK